jgi:hypothetical protein
LQPIRQQLGDLIQGERIGLAAFLPQVAYHACRVFLQPAATDRAVQAQTCGLEHQIDAVVRQVGAFDARLLLQRRDEALEIVNGERRDEAISPRRD